MKIHSIGLIVVMVIGLGACKALNKPTQFYVNYNTSYSYPAGLPIDIPVTSTPDITTNVQQQFKNNNSNSDLVQSVKLNQLTLTITPEGRQTFSFLKSVEIFISAPGQPETKVAYKYDIPNTVGESVSLDLNDAELKQYLSTDSFSLRVQSVTDETIRSGITVNLASRFFVDAKILGI